MISSTKPANVRTYIQHLISQSVSQWNAWPATGRSALQDLRSCAILQASLALSPVSSSIYCTNVRQGRPRWRFHSGLMSGLTPVRASTARRSAEWAGVASGSRRSWPKMESRLRQIRIAMPSSPVWLVTEAFVTKWNQRIPKITKLQTQPNKVLRWMSLRWVVRALLLPAIMAVSK